MTTWIDEVSVLLSVSLTASRKIKPSVTGITFALALLSPILIAGCASFKQEMHAFPKGVAIMLENAQCDCDTVEFLGDNKGRLVRNGVEQGTFSYKKKTLRVDVDDSLLSYLSSSLTIDEVRQKAHLENPFDGRTYVLSGVYEGEKPIVTITLKEEGENARTVGRLDTAWHGVIEQRSFRIEDEHWWESASVRETVNGETLWHQYPAGAYIAIASGKEGTAKIFQGATTDKLAGLDAFTGLRTIAYLPRGQSADYERDLFLFYFGWVFYGEFADDIMSLPYCLDREGDVIQDDCPADMYIH